MAMTLTEKILKQHLVSGDLSKRGSEISIKIDQTLTQDATGTMAYLQFEAMGLDRVKNELAVSYVDHNTVQVGFENFDDHEYLRTVAARKGVIFSRAGNGICHQVHLERFAAPSKTLVGSDSHTPTAGALSSFAMGVGGLDVALSMAGEPFSLIMPRIVKIELKGALRPFVSAKDIILKVLEHFGTKGNVNTVFEYSGEGIGSLSIPERATITNMGAECGVTTSLFPSDVVAKKFLKAQKRLDCFVELYADDGAVYDDQYTIDLSTLEPMIALPHSPGNVKPVSQCKDIKVNQVLIGSCTNSSYYDLAKVACILKDKHVPDTVSLGIAPGSRATLRQITQSGVLDILVSAGARILESACGFCIGNHQSPGTDSVSLRTSNRNFEGRSGTASANVYLVSPEVAAASALKGVITDPQELSVNIKKIKPPKKFLIDDTMFIYPSFAGKILRGPNIGQPPVCTPPSDTLSGKCVLKVGDKITTDHIMPAGSRLKYRSNIEKYSQYVFEPVDKDFSAKALELKNNSQAVFVVAGESYGQGSSREHAAICPMFLGVKAVIAKSIERIHQANLCNFGILPLIFKSPEDYDKIDSGDVLVLKGVIDSIKSGEFTLEDETKGISIPLKLFASERQREVLIAGGRINLLSSTDAQGNTQGNI